MLKTMENMIKFCIVLIFFCLLSSTASMRVKRRTGDQPPSGECSTYKWGGVSGLHWYACCNNCGTSDSSCDGKTYQSASSEKYCGNCGKDTSKGNGELRATYSCGGCNGQDSTSKKCLSSWRSVYKIPGLCWAFAKCFQKRCGSQFSRDLPDMCFNFRCDPGETVENCPTDCCGTKTDKCDWSKLKCVPECCSEPTCCDTSGSGRSSSMAVDKTSGSGRLSLIAIDYVTFVTVSVVQVILINQFII